MRSTAADALGMFEDALPAFTAIGQMVDTPQEFEEKFAVMMSKRDNLKDKIRLETTYNEDDKEKKYPIYKIWIQPVEVFFTKENGEE